MSSLRNIKKYQQCVRQNDGILETDQIQLETESTPADSNLAVGRIYCDGSTIYGYNGSAFVDMLSSATYNIEAWDDIYDMDKTLTVDGSTFTIAGTHATGNNLTLTASGSGDCLHITNSGTGYDIAGTSDEWSIKSSGNVGVVELGSGGTINATDGALSIGSSGTATTLSGTLTVDEASTLTGAVTATASLTITGAAGADKLTVTAGDVAVSDGSVTITDDDNASSLTVTNATSTTGSVVQITADAETTGNILDIDCGGGTISAGGYYINCNDDDSAQFTVGDDGAVVITGKAATDMFTITDGDVVITDGSVTITDGDNAASLSVTNNTATTNDVVVIAGSGAFTGDSFVGITPSGLTSGSAVGITCAALTTGEALLISTDAITSGNAVKITQAGEAMTSGELLTVDNTESGNIATITGNVVSFSSSIEETAGTLTADYDLVLFSRTDKQSHASQYDAQGSVVKIAKTQNKAAGTIVDAVVGLEIVSTSTNSALILGDSISVTSVGVNERSLNIVNACTGKDSVLVTSSGALTNGLAGLHVTTSGDLATGGANLILTVSGSSCDAAARAFEIDAQKDVQAVYIDTDGITNDALYVTHSGNLASGKAVLHVTDGGTPGGDDRYVGHFAFTGTATHESAVLFADGAGKDVIGLYVSTQNTVAANSGGIVLYDDDAGAQGPSIVGHHDSASPAANDQLLGIYAYGEEATSSDTMKYGQMTFEVVASTDGAIEGGVKIGVADGASIRESIYLTDDTLILGDSAAFTMGSNGSQDLTISTNIDTAGVNAGEPKIVFTDGSAGDISITPGTTGLINLVASAPTNTAVTSAHTMTVAEGGFVTCTSAGAYTITLPAVSGNAGLWYIFKKTDAAANAITLDGNGAETIDGAATNATIDAQYDVIGIYCDGAKWNIFTEDLA